MGTKYYGQTFGDLTVVNSINTVSNSGIKQHKVRLICKCGQEDTSTIQALKKGQKTTCKNCKKMNDSKKSSSGTNHSLYRTWRGMVTRCYNEKCNEYKYYGARGITVCPAWLGERLLGETASIDGFRKFIQDMGEKPTNDHSIDRIEVQKNYEPTNCRWATVEEQVYNRTNTLPPETQQRTLEAARTQKKAKYSATIKGETKTISQWAKVLKVTYSRIKADIDMGVAPELAVVSAKIRNTLWKKYQALATPEDYKKCYDQAEKWLKANQT